MFEEIPRRPRRARGYRLRRLLLGQFVLGGGLAIAFIGGSVAVATTALTAAHDSEARPHPAVRATSDHGGRVVAEAQTRSPHPTSGYSLAVPGPPTVAAGPTARALQVPPMVLGSLLPRPSGSVVSTVAAPSSSTAAPPVVVASSPVTSAPVSSAPVPVVTPSPSGAPATSAPPSSAPPTSSAPVTSGSPTAGPSTSPSAPTSSPVRFGPVGSSPASGSVPSRASTPVPSPSGP